MKIEEFRKNNKKIQGMAKKKLGIDKNQEVKPGDMISRMNEKKTLAIKGLI